MGTLIPLVLTVIIDVALPFVYRDIANLFAKNPDTESTLKMSSAFFLLLLLYGAMMIVWRVIEYCVVIFEARVMRDLENRCFSVIQSQKMGFFENSFSGSLVKKAGRFVRAFERIFDWIFFWGVKNGLHLLVTIAVFLFLEPLFGFFALLWTVLFLGGNVIFARWKMRFDEATAAADSRVGGAFADSFANILTIKSFAREDSEKERISELTTDLFQKRKFTWLLQNINFAVQGILMTALEMVLLYLMIDRWKAGTFSVGEYVFFQSFLIAIYTKLWDFGRSLRDLFGALADATEMADILEQVPENALGKSLPVKTGKIEFSSISFGYEKNTSHFKDFSLVIPAEQKVGLVGHSGAGKTTIAKLLLRFSEISAGKILIDHQDIAKMPLREVRKRISLVPQTPELFHRTICENIAFARPEATEEEIWTAACKARAQEFLEKFPQKLETLVGERGVKLSGGERQRIAIARAFLENAPIVILDEATSALDSITERKIQAAIFELLKGKTAVVIAHRLSTILQMDRILVLENGEIVEDGTHRELLAKKGKYEQLWRHQSGDFLGE